MSEHSQPSNDKERDALATPRTDALLEGFDPEVKYHIRFHRTADFARQIERELAHEKDQRASAELVWKKQVNGLSARSAGTEFTIHHDFDLERVSLALVEAVDELYATNERFRVLSAHDKDYRRKNIAKANEHVLKGWIELVVKPLVAKYDRHIQSMQRIVERSESSVQSATTTISARETKEQILERFEQWFSMTRSLWNDGEDMRLKHQLWTAWQVAHLG